MNIRGLAVKMGLLVSIASLAGCQSEHGLLRKAKLAQETESKESPTEVESDSSKILDVRSDKPKPFFKSSRLSGAMSDEGREIERDLGIH